MMKLHYIKRMLFASSLIVLLPSAFAYQNLDKPQEKGATGSTLPFTDKGRLKGIRHIINLNGPFVGDIFDKENDLPSKANLLTQMELSLRRNKIPYVNDDDMSEARSVPGGLKKLLIASARIELKVDAIKDNDGSRYTYQISLKISEPAEILRTGNNTLPVVIWERSTFGYAGSSVAKDSIKKAVDNFLDEFANDFLAVNP